MYENIHTVKPLHVSAIHVAIFRAVHYKVQIHRIITEVFETMYRHKILNCKNN